MKQLLTIELFGQPYTFKADEDFARAKEIADLLVKEVERVETQQTAHSSAVNKTAVLILAALNIAHENYELKKKQEKFYNTVTRRANELIQRLHGGRMSISE